MNDERTRRPSRGGSVAATSFPQSNEPDPFKDIGQLARDARKPTSERFGEEAPDANPQADTSETERPLTERAAHILDAAQIAIVDNIDTLILRAERLKGSIVADTAAVRARITANLNHGARILELSKEMNTQLDELEAEHRAATREQS